MIFMDTYGYYGPFCLPFNKKPPWNGAESYVIFVILTGTNSSSSINAWTSARCSGAK